MTDWSDLGAWYDVLNPWGAGDDFYLQLVMGAERVLDVGCGTGTLLHRARQLGHAGRLCGLDPDPAMLTIARAKADDGIEWLLADAASAASDGEFDLAVMTGHAFQCLITDEELGASLTAIRRALVPPGRFAFETRHPLARAWADWDGASFQTRNPDGDLLTVSYTVPAVTGDVVTVTETLAGKWWPEPQTGEVKLRFLAPEVLNDFLAEAGFTVEEQFGDWNRAPADGVTLTDAGQEIITIARR